jgi:hypothetical protein
MWRQEIDDSASSLKVTLDPYDMNALREQNAGDWITIDNFAQKFPNTPEAKNYRMVNSLRQRKINSDSPKLWETLDHPELFKSYPQVENIRMAVDDTMPIGSAGYSDESRAILLSPMRSGQMRPTKLHEVQHAIQDAEGFATGGSLESAAAYAKGFNTLDEYAAATKSAENSYWDARKTVDQLMSAKRHKGQAAALRQAQKEEQGLKTAWDRLRRANEGDAKDAYHRLAGEAEARATEARMNMNMAQRREVFPLESYDVPIDQLIVRGGLLNVGR